MKKKLTLLIAVLLAVGVMARPNALAIDLSINIGDRPYYEGPTYWDSGYEYVWIAGHEEHGHWVHGHYERHGEFMKEHAKEHHHHHHHDHEDHEDHEDHDAH